MLIGPAGNRLEQRMKMASLLFDEVLVEDEWISVAAGETVAMTAVTRKHLSAWSTPRQRGTLYKQGRYTIMGAPPDAGGLPTNTVGPGFAWVATYDPIRAHLPRRAGWIEFVPPFRLSQDGDQATSDLADEVARRGDGTLGLSPGGRRLVTKSMALDLLAASNLQAVASFDRLHSLAARSFLTRESVALPMKSVPGLRPLELLIPSVSNLSWEDIVRARKTRGLMDLRKVLAEIEEEASEAAASDLDFERLVHRGLEQRMAVELKGNSLWALGSGGIKIAVGLVLGLFGPVGGLIGAGGSALEIAKGTRGRSGRWNAALLSLRRMSEKPLNPSK
jgi:hypothetical protein